ncbi:MAG: Acetylene hydratase [Pelotomaculum sp. PtaB.Bin013]|uniref:Molybdopterin-dependent oxidoreductase n=1 Tax=Pelotomaculum isophthalicicum JI TaxID=947010 RepID=A0A9X4JTW4_9FIRM|nr:molybdopterin-dependent oxidoreductase [Pelotomaculum isophthalicicum]MDF9409414.1 molybdopterin-dependent oxidoreductase [Pelotomaculum isophthalicicum JI]OPX90722.1 MAG: Acetylene hydratase [Pelotomaculum sp. PtaB.Bin013]
MERKTVISDCMSCVWDCGIKVTLEDGKMVKVEGLPEHPVSKGYICPRGEYLPEFVYSPDRIKYPMRRVNNTWERLSWEEALDYAAEKLGKIKEQYGAKSLAIFCGSMGVENIEVAGFAQRFKSAYGTPNLLSVENVCYRARIMARQMTFGRYPMDYPPDARCIVLWGHNPDGSKGILAEMIRDKAKKRVLDLITIDPKRTELAELGLHLAIRPGTDGALGLAMLNVIINEGLYDKEFVEGYTIGFEELKAHVQQYTPEWASEITWVSASDIKATARIFAQTKPACIVQGINTLDQHVNGFQLSRLLSILQIITGNVDKPGTWVTIPFLRMTDLRLPMDIKPIGADQYPLFYSFWGRVSPYGIATLFPQAALESKPYPVRGAIVAAANPVVSFPEANKFIEAFKSMDFMMAIDLFMTETAEMADLVLPACTFMEKDAISYVHGVVHGEPFAMYHHKVVEPVGESKPDWWIWTQLARRLGLGEYFPWNTDEEVMDHLLAPSGIGEELKADPMGKYFNKQDYYAYEKKKILTPSGKIEIYSKTMEDAGLDPLPKYVEPAQSPISTPELAKEYPLIMISGARRQAFTHTQMRHVPHLRALEPEPFVEMHPATAARAGVKDGERVKLSTRNGSIKLRVKEEPRLMPGVVSVPHGWAGDANVNLLTDMEVRDPVTGYPDFKVLQCKVEAV